MGLPKVQDAAQIMRDHVGRRGGRAFSDRITWKKAGRAWLRGLSHYVNRAARSWQQDWRNPPSGGPRQMSLSGKLLSPWPAT